MEVFDLDQFVIKDDFYKSIEEEIICSVLIVRKIL